MESINSSQTRLLYNPQLQSAEMIEKLFVVRQEQFNFLLNNILKEKKNSIPQHHLIIGQRGMGKTTILRRMEVELHKEPYRERFIPLLYREEQYNVKDLAEFWLNTLDALADSLQSEKYPAEMLNRIDQTIRQLSQKASATASKEAYAYLCEICKELKRRPVLLIDNIDIVFSGLDTGNKTSKEQWALRKLLSENGAPIIIGGGITTTDDVVKYDMPFYDFFKIQYLRKLDYEEFVKLLNNLATVTNSDPTVFTTIQQNRSRQKALLELTGGSPRVTVILFDQIAKGFSSDINDELNILADAVTPLYKAKFEELPPQQRVILDAIALNWDAISMRKLVMATHMKNNQLSPQLKRLTDDGWIETTPAYKDKGNAYFISERFFNIYYLIRNSSRRHKDKIYCLSKFLECFYGKEELERISDVLLQQEIGFSEDMRVHLALSMVKLLKPGKRKKIVERTIDTFLKNEELCKEFDFSKKEFLFNKGIKLFNQGRYEEALKSVEKFLEDDPHVWIFKGICLRGLERYEEALVCYEKAIELNTQISSSWAGKGISLLYLNCYEDALNSFEESIRLEEDNPALWAFKGFCLAELERYEESLICYEKAVELNPQISSFWQNRGLNLLDLQRYEEAISSFEESIRLEEDNPALWAFKGFCLAELERYEESLVCYEKAIELNPQISSFWKDKGISLLDLQRYEEALNSFEESIQLEEDNPDLWAFKGFCLREMERYEESVACYQKAIELNPKISVFLDHKGFALIELGQYEEAAVNYEQCLSIDPQNLSAKFSLMFLYRDKLDKIEKATELFNSIDEQDILQNADKNLVCRYYLNKAGFELYNQNRGLAKESLLQAFDVLEKENKLATVANEHWWIKFGSFIVKQGYSAWLLDVLEERGYDVVLSPYYTAIRAFRIEQEESADKAEIYLKNRAVEISDPARIIREKIRKYMD